MSNGAAIAGAVAAAMAIRRQKIIRAFRKHRAVSPETARRLEQLEISESLMFRRLVRRNIIRATPDRRYYLDETREEQDDRQKVAAVGIVLAVIILGLGVFLLLRP